MQIEVIADRNDTVAGDGNVEVDTGRARTIDDIAGMDEEIAGPQEGTTFGGSP